MIDLHIHVLPGLDDGPPDADSALALARAVAEGGVDTVVATSHVSDRYPNHGAELRRAAGALGLELERAGVGLRVVPGAEIEMLRLAQLSVDELGELRLGEGPFLLIEPPLSDAAGDFEFLLDDVWRAGFGVLLAHPERCPAFQREPARVHRLVARGALLSVTASSFSGQRGRQARDLARALMAEGLVHNVSSDAHNLRGRSPGLREPLMAAGRSVPDAEALLPWLTEEVPASILRGDPLPPRPVTALTRRRRRWRPFGG